MARGTRTGRHARTQGRSRTPGNVHQGMGADGDVLICLPGDTPRYFSDDVRTACAGCGVTIHHRPYWPANTTNVCPDCAVRYVYGRVAS
jgi:hypothetical protein